MLTKTETFKSHDDILEQLVNARREEVVRLQRSQADQLKELETRAQARITDLKKTLPKDIVAVLDSLDKEHEEASAATKSRVDALKTRFADSVSSAENETAMHPGVAGGHLVAPKQACL